MLFFTTNSKLLSDKQESSWTGEGQEPWALLTRSHGTRVVSALAIWRRSSLGLLRRLAEGRQMERGGSFNMQLWSTGNRTVLWFEDLKEHCTLPIPLLISTRPSPQINDGEKLQCSDSFCSSAAPSDWKCQWGEWYTSRHERRVQKYSPTARKCRCLHSRTRGLLNRTQQHHPRDLRPTLLQSNFVSPILGIREEHERSYATNHSIPSASATYSSLPRGKSLSLFLSLFKMGAKLVTYHKGVFS